jgi:transcription antitermination factor NusG
MPILSREDDIFPENLLTDETLLAESGRKWMCVYTLSRREKEFMRRLVTLEIPHFGPMIPKRFRSPNGRLRTSFIPLFPNYVFIFANDQDRYQAMTTNCVSRCTPVDDSQQLVTDLRRIRAVIEAGVALTPEARLEPGNWVRVRSGPFAGYEGSVIRREGKTRLLLSIHFLEQGVSMELDEGLLEPT